MSTIFLRQSWNNKMSAILVLGVQKSSELFFVKFNLYSYVIVRKWLAT